MEEHFVDGKKKYRFKVPHDENDFRLSHCLRIIREWGREDTVPWMRRHTANYLAPRIAWWVSLLILIVHAWWAASASCGFNFSRGGALVVFVSAVAFGWIAWHEPKAGVLGGGPVNKLTLFHPLFMLPFLAALGTLINSYGDLIPFGNAC